MITEIQAKEPMKQAKHFDRGALARMHQAPCISIYMGGVLSERTARERLAEVKEAVRGAFGNFPGTATAVEEAQELVESNWHLVQSLEPEVRGAAIFLSKDFAEAVPLPEAPTARVAVGSEFYVRPLLSLLPGEDRYFLLTLSQKHVKLYEGSGQGLKERHLLDTPDNLHEDLEALSFEHRYEMHTAASLDSHQKGAVFHGPSLRIKDRLIHFFRDVDRGVANALKGQESPLVVACVEYLFPIYKEANTYPHLLEEVIAGNPDQLSPNALHAASWKLVEKHLAEAGERAFKVYNAHANTALTSGNLRKIVADAARGIVRFLFLPADGERWGTFDPPETVHIHVGQEPGDEELLNLAAVLTLRNGGQAFTIPAGQLPQGVELAAVFRF